MSGCLNCRSQDSLFDFLNVGQGKCGFFKSYKSHKEDHRFSFSLFKLIDDFPSSS